MNLLTFLLLVLFYKEAKCICRQSYVTFCDNLEEMDALDDFAVENWTDVVVGDENADRSQLRTVNFESFALDRFDNLMNLIVVRQIKDIEANTFKLDPEEVNVDYVKLYGNEIKRIRANTFSAKLRHLSLSNNSIENIDKGAFRNCYIQVIDLSYNNMEKLEGRVFSDEFLGSATKKIIFTHNRLRSVEPFSLPSSLVTLKLDHNNINSLSYGIFDNLINLEVLILSHNKMISLPKIRNLTEIVIVDASHNSIQFLESTDLNQLSNLAVLDLSHNKISNPAIFRQFNLPLRDPPLQISLAFNRLTHLVIEGVSFRHHIVVFYGNPWHCKCWESLEKFMVENKVKRNGCDLKYFGNGRIPYCINYPSDGCVEEQERSFNETVDVGKFLENVERTLSVVNCKLALRPL